MDREKEIYLNTERLNELYRNESTVSASVPSLSPVGGLRFTCETARKIKLELFFPSLASTYTPYIDGRAAAKCSAPYFGTEIVAERGDHIFDFVSDASHGGAILRVTGVGVKEGRSYIERVGGYYTGAKNVLFLRRGDRAAEKITRQGSTVTKETLGDRFRDGCLLYDGNNGYVDTVFTVGSAGDTDLRVDTGTTSSITVQNVTSAAIADGQALPAGHDCLIAYVDGGVLHFCTAVRNGGVTASTSTLRGVRRVVSSQRGTILLVETEGGVWHAFVFGTGSGSVTVGNVTLPYTTIDLTRNKVFAPSADLEGQSMIASYYFKDARNVLVKKTSAGTSALGYADAYYAGATNGVFLQGNEIVRAD